MKKSMIISTIAAVLVFGGSAAIYAQTSNQQSAPSSNSNALISASDYSRIMDIVIKVNKGELPVSALKDAEQLLEKNGLEGLSINVREEYLKLK